MYSIFYYILYFPEETTILNSCHFIVTNTIYFSQCRNRKFGVAFCRSCRIKPCLESLCVTVIFVFLLLFCSHSFAASYESLALSLVVAAMANLSCSFKRELSASTRLTLYVLPPSIILRAGTYNKQAYTSIGISFPFLVLFQNVVKKRSIFEEFVSEWLK